jgi:hypothetical protein
VGTENTEKIGSGIDFMESVFVLKKNGAHELQVVVRQCAKEELEDIMELQKTVYDTVTEKDTFVFSTEDELSESLATDVCLGAYLSDRLIAFTLVVTSPYSPRNLGYYMDYSREQCDSCVTYDTTFVHPSFTGYGLQRLFLTLKDLIAAEAGAHEALATVSPDNTISLTNLKAGGFVIAEDKKLYGDRRRYIMRKSLV